METTSISKNTDKSRVVGHFCVKPEKLVVSTTLTHDPINIL
ncbi:MAG: hypothetical protein QME51_08145 [Planctomycetota bacterium]|nr:hypothetical protein [Planctomycetota bacterium]